MRTHPVLSAALFASLLTTVAVPARASVMNSACAGGAAEDAGVLEELVDDLKDVWTDSRDFVIDKSAQLVGVLELTGFRYPVKHYEAKVSDDLYRGSRLDDDRREDLAGRGFESVVDLTLEGTGDAEHAPHYGLDVHEVEILDNSHPTDEQMKEYLDFVTNPENQPAYVHCQAGKGRTGIAVAVYRMAVEGWSLEAALGEAREYGLSLPNQVKYLTGFSERLDQGLVEGYPKVPRGPTLH